MAATAYPHMIFATGPDVITKELLREVLAEAYPHGTVTDAPLKSVLTLGDYSFSFWFDDEAEGLAERYAGYLPEGARRRRLTACTTMIDFSGAPDPDRAHRADAERIVSELAELDGVWVFSEESKRFVAFDYGEPPLSQPVESGESVEPVESVQPGPEPAPEPEPEPEPVEPSAPVPAPAAMTVPEVEPMAEQAPGTQPAPDSVPAWQPTPASVPGPLPAPAPKPPAQPTAEPPAYQPAAAYEPATQPSYDPPAQPTAVEPLRVPDLPIEPTVESEWSRAGQDGPATVPDSPEPQRTIPLPGEAAQPRPEMPPPTHSRQPGAPDAPGERAAYPQDEEEKTRFFKRVFKRKNP